MDRERTVWLALCAGTAIGAGMLARRGAAEAWRRTRHEEPPINAAHPATDWRRMLAWAAVSGFCVAFARVLGHGAADGVWRRALGRDPQD